MIRYLYIFLAFISLGLAPLTASPEQLGQLGQIEQIGQSDQFNAQHTAFSVAIDQIDANVVFMRHALAPGYGDPDHFDIDQCATQRNLNATGRQQAQDIGLYIKSQGVRFDAILSSQWCRCVDTAIALDLGEWQRFAGLNSFFQDHVDRTETLALLSDRLETIADDELILMVTHQVVISAVTRYSTPSGGLVLYNSRTGKAKPLSIP